MPQQAAYPERGTEDRVGLQLGERLVDVHAPPQVKVADGSAGKRFQHESPRAAGLVAVGPGWLRRLDRPTWPVAHADDPVGGGDVLDPCPVGVDVARFKKDFEAKKAFSNLGAAKEKVDHVDLYYNAGHPGVAEPHYHIVVWYVSPDKAASLK